MTERNVVGGELELCGDDPVTGIHRDGYCQVGVDGGATHTICVVVTEPFLAHQRAVGNDVLTPRPEYRFPGLHPGDRWCVVAVRWRQAYEAGAAAPVVVERPDAWCGGGAVGGQRVGGQADVPAVVAIPDSLVAVGLHQCADLVGRAVVGHDHLEVFLVNLFLLVRQPFEPFKRVVDLFFCQLVAQVFQSLTKRVASGQLTHHQLVLLKAD